MIYKLDITCEFAYHQRHFFLSITVDLYKKSHYILATKRINTFQIINIIFFSFLATPVAYGSSGPGTNLSHNCNLCHSCGKAGSLMHCAGLGIKPIPQQQPKSLQRHTAVPHQELQVWDFKRANLSFIQKRPIIYRETSAQTLLF